MNRTCSRMVHCIPPCEVSGATVRLTLLRSPAYPDPDTDRGEHVVRFGIVPGADVVAAQEHGYAAHLPLRGSVPSQPGPDPSGARPLVEVDGPGAVIEAVKLAEDGSGDVVVRLYESLGGRRSVGLRTSFAVASLVETDLLEDANSPAVAGRRALSGWNGEVATLDLRPFQIVTLRLARAQA
jgi:alpha-mannosidase